MHIKGIIIMGRLFITLAISFLILFIVNVTWLVWNLYLWAVNGLQYLLQGMNFTERIYASIYLKWILLADGIWWLFLLTFLLKRKHYRTDPQYHYLSYKPILNPTACIIIPTFNEEPVIEKVVSDYINQKNVKHVIVIDNHSTDRTADIAERCGANVIRKESNKGFADSCVIGLKESLKTDANIIVLTESDGTFSGYDIQKMLPYLDNCDVVIGTRQIQVLSEKGNQNSMFYVWGNFLLAKLIQLKYFSLLHMGVVQLSDVGCMHRCIRRDALEKIIDGFTRPDTNEVIISNKSGIFSALMIMLALKNNLKIVEVPVTFKKRVGVSKTGADKKMKAIRYGLEYLWYIIKS